MSWVESGVARAYRESGWWSEETLAGAMQRHATSRPNDLAYSCGPERITWSDFELETRQIAGLLIEAGVVAGERVAVCLSDSVELHVLYVALERLGATVVGIGAKAGRREVRHLLSQVGARLLITGPCHGGSDSTDLVTRLRVDGVSLGHLVLTRGAHGPSITHNGDLLMAEEAADDVLADRRLGPDDLYLINSTSGTTGMPKAVMHTQNRWNYFHQKATENGALVPSDVLLAAVPAPFGFGQWTSHTTPILLGAHTVLLDRFSPEAMLQAIERERVTVLCCVSTQFILMLAADMDRYDLSSLRVVFTGGEAVPYERAREFERRTGATILQFYGSNETGLLSGTNLNDSLERRLRSAGRIVPEMQVRLFDGERDVTEDGRGQPACRGPATGIGYLDDKAANEQLFTADGWMLMGDICEIDSEGYLTVVGRISDFIVRGGKNISLPVVEGDVLEHPAVAHAAAVGMPDPVFGERVCVYVELVSGAELTLELLIEHLEQRGVSKELYPERLIVLDELPRSSGAKIAKGDLRADIVDRLATEAKEQPVLISHATGGTQ